MAILLKKKKKNYLRYGNNSREDIFAGKYLREKKFLLEDIFAGRFFRGKIFSREQYIRENIFSRKYLKFTFRENFLPRK